MEAQMCFDCLRCRIEADFSDEIIFSHGLSDSLLPFGSKAVVQMSNSIGENSNQFILVYQPSDPHDCFSRYIDEYILETFEGNENGMNNSTSVEKNRDQTEKISRSGGKDTPDFGPEKTTCIYCSKFSCSRTITALMPVAQVSTCSYATFKELSSNYLSGSLEENVVISISNLIKGKSTGRDSINFLSLIGVPSFDEDGFPGCLRHPNIAPVLGLLKSPSYIAFVLPKTPYTLETILHYSPDALKSEWHIRFLFYQILSALAYLHGLSVTHGDIRPSNVMLTNLCWSWLQICDKSQLRSNLSSRTTGQTAIPSPMNNICIEGCHSQGLYGDLKISSSKEWKFEFRKWWRGELSNFDYLLILNKLAGRRWGDHTFHTVMPWVIDFSLKPDNDNCDGGWRDLSKSKWRLAKGDEQLDFTYSTSEIPHHVSDECLSELAVCSYKARRLPLSVLRLAVRSVYEPNEYPSTMQRLYQWTPDECIPEFYSDPHIFYSLHSGMTNLAVPTWAGNPEEFIKLHRDALESENVSSQIHHWIDITFGYKMSGQAAISAKNVMLPSTDPTTPQSVGRRQLFNEPHPIRRCASSSNGTSRYQSQINDLEKEKALVLETDYLQKLEEVDAFSEHASHLGPLYSCNTANKSEDISVADNPMSNTIFKEPLIAGDYGLPPEIDASYLLESFEMDDEGSMGYQEFMLWKEKLSHSKPLYENVAEDIFSVGCVLAELNLKRPLFDSTSLVMYMERGILPKLFWELPYHTKVIVEACIQKDWWRRPSAKHLLESPYFPKTISSSYLFIAPLQLLATDGSRLHYAANFAKQGALKAMGTFSAEICAPYCVPLLVNSLSDTEAEWAYILLKEFLKCLKPKAVKALILPSIQKILQATDYSHLKVSLLQDSFVQEVWNTIGKQAYLETLHPIVISNLYLAPHKSSAAASVLLIGSSEELGVPITINQTILPLIHCFGKGLSTDGIDVLIRIGGLLGENFTVRQIIPLLKNVVHSCIDLSKTSKSEPVQSWISLSLIDSLMALDGLVGLLPREVVVKELIEEGNCLHATLLMQSDMEITVLQVAATTLLAVCERIGPDLTSLHVLPQLKELFEELIFSQKPCNGSNSDGRNTKIINPIEDETPIESRIDLVLLMYPSFASLLGIEKLRQCCATWLLVEQFLQQSHNWKWEYSGESSRSALQYLNSKRFIFNKNATSAYSPAPTKLLLNGVGWSIPQSHGIRSAKNLVLHKQFSELHNPVDRHRATTNHGKREPWFWLPNSGSSWDGLEFLGRVGGLKDELPWKIRSTVLHSVRAHPGALRSLAVCRDECTVFTAGIGPGFKGTVHRWNLTGVDCLSGYYGHEEVVNDICVLSSTGRVASSDGTVHVWNSQTGKLISVFSEPSADSAHFASPLSSGLKNNSDPANMLNSNSLSSGILTSAFDGSLYTSMHLLEFSDKLVLGTGNGSLRFIDVMQGKKLHMWRSESSESGFPSLVSAICSCGYDKMQTHGSVAFPSWIAAGLSSGICKMLDLRSGNVIASWRAHDGYITKLATPDDHLLVSSSLDKTLRIWDLRRNWPSQNTVFKGHREGVSGFSVWGQDIISISRNKIGLASLSRAADEDGQHRVTPRNLYAADNGSKFLSALSSISILPFSRLFLVGTEDGYLRICC